MRLAILLIAGGLLLIGGGATKPAAAFESVHAASFDAMSAQSKKKRQGSRRPASRSGTQIACTEAGCAPIPPGCRIRPGMNPFTWNPTGFDEVVCPYRR